MVIAFVLERETCILVAEIGLYVASVQVTADLRVNSRFGKSDGDDPQAQVGLSRGIDTGPDQINRITQATTRPQPFALPHSISQRVDSQLRRPVPPADSRIPDFHQISDRQVRRDGDEDVGGSQYRKIEPSCS